MSVQGIPIYLWTTNMIWPLVPQFSETKCLVYASELMQCSSCAGWQAPWCQYHCNSQRGSPDASFDDGLLHLFLPFFLEQNLCIETTFYCFWSYPDPDSGHNGMFERIESPNHIESKEIQTSPRYNAKC